MTSATIKQYIIFIIGSVLGAIIDYFLVLLLVIHFMLPEWGALGISMLISSIVVYKYHSHITFKITKNNSTVKNSMLKYILLSVIIYLFRLIALKFFALWFISFPLVLFLSLLLVSIVNFILSKLIIFKSSNEINK